MMHPDSTPPSDEPSDDPLAPDLRALVAEADARPTLRPSRDLWPEIAARLDARASDRPAPADVSPAGVRVLAFRPPGRATGHEAGHVHAPRRRWLAAAAVALVALSSGTTYLAVRRPAEPPSGSSSLARASDAPNASGVPARGSARGSAPEEPTTGPHDPAPRAAPALADAAPRRAARASFPAEARDEPHARPALRSVARAVDLTVPGAADYDREIADLRSVVAERHGELDSATVDVLARNLRIIDAAIAASRAALARDPHSPFLGEQLTRALGQKVDLLRTAALLPRT